LGLALRDKPERAFRSQMKFLPEIPSGASIRHLLEGGIDDPAVICAALLHDILEDTETTVEELEGTFGATIAGYVVEVTDDKALPKGERKRLQVEHAAHLSEGARLVKLADKISNLRDLIEHPPADWPLTRRREYFDWARQVVDGLRGIHPELETVFDRLCRQAPVT
ncbi:MAG: HD domain-containing protein, partial [Candidatus Competibacterales bacterium]|nr:HD domain-containing protein [Candidatus Competibacterales bacterium]